MDNAALQVALDGLVTQLTSVSTNMAEFGPKLEKITNEVVVAISSAGVVSPEVEIAVGKLNTLVTAMNTTSQTVKDMLQGLDDLNTDTPPVAG